MPHTLASDLAQKSLDVLLEHAGQSRNGSVDETKELLDNCEYPYLLIERLWRSIQESLDRGVEKRKFTALVKDCLDVIERTAGTMNAIRERVKVAPLSPQDKTVGLSLLAELDRGASDKRNRLTELVRWLEKPRPEIDVSKLPANRGDPDAKGYISHEELVARLLSEEEG